MKCRGQTGASLVEAIFAAALFGMVSALVASALLQARALGDEAEKLSRAALLAANALEQVKITGRSGPVPVLQGYEQQLRVQPFPGSPHLREAVIEVTWGRAERQRLTLRTLVFPSQQESS